MNIGDQVLFKGYSGNTPGYEPVLAPGDACVVVTIDGDVGLRIRKIPAQPRKTDTEWVLMDEVLPLDTVSGRGDPRPDPRRVFPIMARENSKKFADLRDRVAYMFVTGAHPTHMRPFFTGALNLLSSMVPLPGRFGPHLIDPSAVYSLDLNNHPMVIEASRLVSEGWRLVVSLGHNHRRSYNNLYFSCGQQRLTVNAEGWTRPGWPTDWKRRSARR